MKKISILMISLMMVLTTVSHIKATPIFEDLLEKYPLIVTEHTIDIRVEKANYVWKVTKNWNSEDFLLEEIEMIRNQVQISKSDINLELDSILIVNEDESLNLLDFAHDSYRIASEELLSGYRYNVYQKAIETAKVYGENGSINYYDGNIADLYNNFLIKHENNFVEVLRKTGQAKVYQGSYLNGLIAQQRISEDKINVSIALDLDSEVEIYEIIYDDQVYYLKPEYRGYYKYSDDLDLGVIINPEIITTNQSGTITINGRDYQGNLVSEDAYEFHLDTIYPKVMSGGGILETRSTFEGVFDQAVDNYNVIFPNGERISKITENNRFKVEYVKGQDILVKENEFITIEFKHPEFGYPVSASFTPDGYYLTNLEEIVELELSYQSDLLEFQKNKEHSLDAQYQRKLKIADNHIYFSLQFPVAVENIYLENNYGTDFYINKINVEDSCAEIVNLFQNEGGLTTESKQERYIYYEYDNKIYALNFDTKDYSLKSERILTAKEKKDFQKTLMYFEFFQYDVFNKLPEGEKIADEFTPYFEIDEFGTVQEKIEVSLATAYVSSKKSNFYESWTHWNIEDQIIFRTSIPFHKDTKVIKIVIDGVEVQYAHISPSIDFSQYGEQQFATNISFISHEKIIEGGTVQLIGYDYSGKKIQKEELDFHEKVFQAHPMWGGADDNWSEFGGFMPRGVEEYLVLYPDGSREFVHMESRDFKVRYETKDNQKINLKEIITVFIKHPQNGVWIRNDFSMTGDTLYNRDAIAQVLSDIENMDLTLYTEASVSNLLVVVESISNKPTSILGLNLFNISVLADNQNDYEDFIKLNNLKIALANLELKEETKTEYHSGNSNKETADDKEIDVNKEINRDTIELENTDTLINEELVNEIENPTETLPLTGKTNLLIIGFMLILVGILFKTKD